MCMAPDFISYIQSRFRLEGLQKALRSGPSADLNLPLGALPFVISPLVNDHNCFYIARDEMEAEEVFESLRSSGVNAYFFPEVDVIPYSNVFPSADKLSDRMNTLYALNKGDKMAVVLTAESFLRKLPPVSALDASRLELVRGGRIDRDKMTEKLVELAYIREHKVVQQGTFSVRGDIIDIFPPNFKDAVRINLFGDVIESIRTFNPLTQLSMEQAGRFTLIPAGEFSLQKEKVNEKDKDLLGETHIHSHFLKFYSKHSSLPEYSKNPCLVIYPENVLAKCGETLERYKVYTPFGEKQLLSSFDEVMSSKPDNKQAVLRGRPVQDNLGLNCQSAPVFGEGFSRFVSDIEQVYLARDYRLFILVEYEDLAKRLMNILKKFGPVLLDRGQRPDDSQKLNIVIIGFEHGFELDDGNEKVLLLTESDISGKKRLFRKRIRQIDTIFEDIEDIKVDESVVHLNYGIGLFKGIERVNVLGKEKDYILLEYADKEKLFVPLEQSHLIGKYVGGTGKKTALDSLGGKSWAKKRDRVQKSIEEFASKLVAIYAKRSAMSGHSFAKDTLWQKEFEDRFEYIETPDQVKVIAEIKKDMEDVRPMDRLLCGDVGFGKTEVAMRAAFKAVMDGKQVALIAPTTVLVEQHYYTFMERFKNFPVKIDYVSRFTDSKRMKNIIRDLETHKLDLIIGTHKLFSEDIRFRSLGLVVIDEEHKFGVNHKEIMKSRYPMVDFLSLSATPIPRTLNMAMAAIRDISLLQTPPDMRIPVETHVADFSIELVQYAIGNELARDGQVFFVHNTIKRLPEFAFQIERLVPGARVTIGHGQMEEETLDKAFMGFVRGEFNVFVCTTIIDSGLDIPNANTIIISDAHKFGLSQLYQLKGRVGRAKKQGYAYFLYPENKALSENAQKRLYVINEYTDLGAGFNIALQDLEIRGAGNILGREQHGNIIAVGYDVYMRLLREEVEKLKGTWQEKVETLIDLKYNAFIPESYISDSATKMEVYKKILSVANEDEIKFLHTELTDRFGAIPQEVGTLFEISRLKIKAQALGVETIMEKGDNIEMTFSRFSRVDAAKVMHIKMAGKHEISIKPHEKDKIFYKSFDSNIAVKVKRLVSFMNDIAEE